MKSIKNKEKYFGKKSPKKKTPSKTEVIINKRKIVLKNLDKIFWPAEKYTKGDLIEYYREISPVLLPYLKDRPESMLRFPDGIKGESFFQKNIEYAPEWAETTEIRAESENKKVNYLLCQDEATLVYMVNLGCIDLNPWNSRVGHLDNPDYLIMDLDPEETDFGDVIKTALTVRGVLESAGITGYPKTSGASGMHIYIPLGAKYNYEQARQFSQIIAQRVNEKIPEITSIERSPSKRKGKVYLDCFQNAEGQTLASVYSVRAKPGATVSAPLDWQEVNKELSPRNFTIKNIIRRIQKRGDLFKGVLGKGIDMKKALNKL